MHVTDQAVVTLGAVLIVNRLLFPMSACALVAAQTVASVIDLAEILLAVGDDLQ